MRLFWLGWQGYDTKRVTKIARLVPKFPSILKLNKGLEERVGIGPLSLLKPHKVFIPCFDKF